MEFEFLKSKKEIPDQKDVKKMMDEADKTIAKNQKEKEEFSKMLETMLINSWMAGERTASVQGTKKDKMFLMILIDTAVSGIAAGAVVLYLFL